MSKNPYVERAVVPGYLLHYLLLRLLAEREASRVFLARDAAGTLGALKLRGPRGSTPSEALTARLRRLQPLSETPGLLPILAHGVTADGWLWEWLPLADNLPGLPPVTEASALDQYTPLTLRAQLTEMGPSAAVLVAQWGVRLVAGLAALHAAGLVHRDVKPGNILFLTGEPCLADYGLTGEASAQQQFDGTEGYRPLEGTSDASGDLFALGKTLYEAWTGNDRLEFPSLPRRVLDAPEWNPHGRLLNEVLLQACHAEPARRFRSAAEFAAALKRVITGEALVSRRRWVLTAVGLVAAGLGVSVPLWLQRAPARVVWRRVRQKGFNVEGWASNPGTADWARKRMYSFNWVRNRPLVQAVALDTFDLEPSSLSEAPGEARPILLHPESRDLWLMDGGRGEVFAVNPDTHQVRRLGGGPNTERNSEAAPYWNPLTRRVGAFGGYGQHTMSNERSEFEPAGRRWVVLDPDRTDTGPCRRNAHIPLVPDPSGRSIFLVGGYGSRSGKQGEQTPGWRCFDTRFHWLDDIWELDLENNNWTCRLPLGHFSPLQLRAAVHFPALGGLVIFEGLSQTDTKPAPARTWLLRPGRDRKPVRLPAEGEPSRLGQAWAWTFDPRDGDLLMFADDGIFRLSLNLA